MLLRVCGIRQEVYLLLVVDGKVMKFKSQVKLLFKTYVEDFENILKKVVRIIQRSDKELLPVRKMELVQPVAYNFVSELQ
jgi:hypothetical protein